MKAISQVNSEVKKSKLPRRNASTHCRVTADNGGAMDLNRVQIIDAVGDERGRLSDSKIEPTIVPRSHGPVTLPVLPVSRADSEAARSES